MPMKISGGIVTSLRFDLFSFNIAIITLSTTEDTTMNHENLISWMAETVTGGRPACATRVIISDNGRHRSFKEYRLLLSYEDENGDVGSIQVTPEEWSNALKAAIAV